MASNFGNLLKISIFGESHSKAIGMTIDGLPAGIKVDESRIQKMLDMRHGIPEISTQRHEPDNVEYLCGVFNGFTTGSPLTFIIHNKDVDSNSYEKGLVRPSHSDLTAYLKYNGYNDYRGGGSFSGRITASFIVLGAICDEILYKNNIQVSSRVYSIKDINDDEMDLTKLNDLKDMIFPTINKEIGEKMIEEIKLTKEKKDSLGGIIETYVSGLPVGLGEPYFDSLESVISHLIFSLGGVKGIEFGDGFNISRVLGSQANDQMKYDERGNIVFSSNHNGGVNGGISNGNILSFRTAIKPTPSISLPQETINLETKQNETIEIKGRHDPCFVPRVLPVINALVSYVLVDMMMVQESKNI